MTMPADDNMQSNVLHLVFSVGQGAFESCRSASTAGDTVVFLDNGVRQLLLGEPGKLLPPGVAVYYSEPDLEARGLASPARDFQVRILRRHGFSFPAGKSPALPELEMKQPELQLPDGDSLPLDEKGYLLEYAAWTPCVAETMAANDGIRLQADHWVVLHLFRDYFEQHEIEPPMRALVKKVRESLGQEKGSSAYLYRLFPAGPGIQACRYAGLPRPLSCV